MKNILYVDDSPEDRELITYAFARSARMLRLEAVGSGERGCDYLAGAGRFADRARYPFPDLVLLDLKMTDMSGFDLLRWIRLRPKTAELKVTIYSSSFVDADVETARRLGADAFVTKPSSWERQVEFARVLQECCLCEPPDLGLLQALPEYRGYADGKCDFSHRP